MTNLRRCRCGRLFWVERRFNNLTHYPVFIDQEPGVPTQFCRVETCPGCHTYFQGFESLCNGDLTRVHEREEVPA